MTKEEQIICELCMDEVKKVLQKHGCQFDIMMLVSSLHGTQFQIRTVLQKTLMVAQEVPKVMNN